MRIRRPRGFTLVEALIVISMVALVVMAITMVYMQATKVFVTTSTHIEPQASQMLALKRMENTLREAILVEALPSSSTWVSVTLPAKDPTTRMNVLVEDPETHELYLTRGKTVSFFLGRRIYPEPANDRQWTAIPDTQGDTIFRIDDTSQRVNGGYPNAEVIISGILSTPVIPDPDNPSVNVPTTLFSYWPENADGTPTVDTQLVKITLSAPIRESVRGVNRTAYHTLWTQFCLRNLKKAQREDTTL